MKLTRPIFRTVEERNDKIDKMMMQLKCCDTAEEFHELLAEHKTLLEQISKYDRQQQNRFYTPALEVVEMMIEQIKEQLK